MSMYYLVIDCETCGEDIEYGPILTFNEVRGHVSIGVRSIEQTRFDCENCGGETYIGDIDTHHEEGEVPPECDLCGEPWCENECAEED